MTINPLKYILSIWRVYVCVPMYDCKYKLYTQPLFSRQNKKRVVSSAGNCILMGCQEAVA